MRHVGSFGLRHGMAMLSGYVMGTLLAGWFCCFQGTRALAVDYTATSVSGGTWQTTAPWSVVPTGSVNGYPNNVGTDVFDVFIPNNVTFDLNADVTIRDITISNGMVFNNAANRTIHVEGDAVVDGIFTTQSSLHIILDGTTQINGTVQLLNGASALNNGTLIIGPTSTGIIAAGAAVGPIGYTLRNTGTFTLNRASGANMQNFVIQNVGVFNVFQGAETQITSYTQTAGITQILGAGGMQGNNFSFQGGTLMVEGSGLTGSSINFAGVTVEIGPAVDQAGAVTINGNLNVSAPSTFNYDIGGTTPITQFDQLTTNTGIQLNQITLSISFINGFIPTAIDAFPILLGNNLNGPFANEVGGLVILPGVGQFDVIHNQNSIVLTNFVVPEPSVTLLLGMASACLLLRRSAPRRLVAQGVVDE
ncbi:PEP-CTERM sorting domain-containing protein [Roseimicrobium sp. ORNL1]|uniref:PEP-CTERM sorting domain-containing protein n=1 Tax=Roseimicrobium sp. ORNL1 TaxID=2711231 RepID=UPI0013E1500D|nr:PEP-CTERM sorting domain-containing protein [Roseimicrobium sp. ORNL1]QIF02088.1 PEP-CTERM sorting domain-containing protein [Roseimicrobium sp. ORNL1]